MSFSSLQSFLQKTFTSKLKPPPTTSKTIQTSLSSLLLSLPLAIYLHDKLYTTVTIVGSSMEPTLHDGDVLLIRRSDAFFLKIHRRHQNNSTTTPEEEEEEEDDNDVQHETSKIQKTDAMVGKFPSRFLSTPPLVLRGDVVVYQDGTTSFPNRWNVKRVIGLGGQRVRTAKQYHTFQSIPLYSLWVEGDNTHNSHDSNTTGPISKKSIVGVAEYIIWPPSRAWGGGNGDGSSRFFWRDVERIQPLPGRAWWA
eukprot:CAMPEP_0185724268 /NCGR_PEP_ID=MMETSP1171-20130828/800_1 /TAXON_ID=374046 /ORGANISM="Helicotheca tamensis, Strain CCMP826" /LENGTH=251 /DNA_ID=CAMNT_0028392077 /DNA_START=184 /DNA_END=939 /DNA_ORIENTATION=-